MTALVILLAVVTPVWAETPMRAVPQDLAQVQLSLAPVVKKAQPAVVNVYESDSKLRE